MAEDGAEDGAGDGVAPTPTDGEDTTAQTTGAGGDKAGGGSTITEPRAGAHTGRVMKIEDHVAHFMRQIELPPPGGVLAAQIFDQEVRYTRQPLATLPHIDDDSVHLLFKCLSPCNVLHVVRCLLLEQRVLVRSAHVGALAPCSEALLALLFPHCWEHVYVPLLPTQLMEYVQAPMPFLIGIETANFAQELAQFDDVGDSSLDDALASAVIVDLDSDRVLLPPSLVVGSGMVMSELPSLPPHLADRVLHRLQQIAVPACVSRLHGHRGGRASWLASADTADAQWRHTLRKHKEAPRYQHKAHTGAWT